ncbi:MAG: hypothetical protein RLZZ597_3402 [Cyanobacteriota bacterium]|jgi:hypothetical protein
MSTQEMAQTQASALGQAIAQGQGETAAKIADGLYIMGGTSQGLEVSGNQYRYYSEGGEEEWQPVSDLTLIQPGLIFDGRNYWCINTPTEPGVCTERGWRTIAERLAEQEAEETESSSEPGASTEPQPVTVASRELSVGGFRSGDQRPNVLQQLGQPQRMAQEYYTRYEFPGLTLWFDQDYLVDIKSTSADYCTPSGVCPGMTAEAVRQIYGDPVMSEREDGQFMEYYVEGETCWLKIGLAGEQVSSVGVACMI